MRGEPLSRSVRDAACIALLCVLSAAAGAAALAVSARIFLIPRGSQKHRS